MPAPMRAMMLPYCLAAMGFSLFLLDILTWPQALEGVLMLYLIMRLFLDARYRFLALDWCALDAHSHCSDSEDKKTLECGHKKV